MNGSVTGTAAQVTSDVKDQVTQGFHILDSLQNFVLNNLPDLIMAVIIFVLGRYLAKIIRKVVEKMLERANYDHTAMTFIGQIIYYGIMFLVIITTMHKIGIPTDSFVTAIGAFGIAIGLALQNNLSNFASGMLILVFKPFKAGDWISVDGMDGTVRNIQLLNTTITTKENRTVFVPNSIITSQKVMNSSYMPTRYISFIFDISYNNDHHKAIEVIKGIFAKDERVINAGTVEIGIKEFGDNSVRIAAFPLVQTKDFLSVYYSIMSDVKDRFDEEGIEIPYPQRVVYLERSADTEGENENASEPGAESSKAGKASAVGKSNTDSSQAGRKQAQTVAAAEDEDDDQPGGSI